MGNIKKLASFYSRLFNAPKVDMGSFEDRVLFQKAVYLAKALGIGFGEYEFDWYVHGPYSPSLTTDGYKLYASSENHCTYRFTASEEKKIGTLKGLFPDEIEKRDWNRLELYASILFYFEPPRPDEALAKLIKGKKGWYSDEEIREGIRKIKELKTQSKD